MAKSIRSKHVKKLKAAKRLRLKPKLDQKLRDTLSAKTTEEVSDGPNPLLGNAMDDKTDLISEHQDVIVDTATITSTADNDDDANMEETNSSVVKYSRKNAKVPLHLLSQRKVRKIQGRNKANRKKNKIFKW